MLRVAASYAPASAEIEHRAARFHLNPVKEPSHSRRMLTGSEALERSH